MDEKKTGSFVDTLKDTAARTGLRGLASDRIALNPAARRHLLLVGEDIVDDLMQRLVEKHVDAGVNVSRLTPPMKERLHDGLNALFQYAVTGATNDELQAGAIVHEDAKSAQTIGQVRRRLKEDAANFSGNVIDAKNKLKVRQGITDEPLSEKDVELLGKLYVKLSGELHTRIDAMPINFLLELQQTSVER